MQRLLLIVLMSLLSSCSSLFYWPTSALYSDPWQEDIPFENIFFKSEDGTQLHSWLLKHKGAQNSKGLVTFFHGNAQNLTAHAPIVAWLTSHGYDVFLFDYRGYGLSEGSPSPSRIELDARAALEYSQEILKRLGGPRWIVFGQSLGGAIAAKTMASSPYQARADLLVLDSTFPSYYNLAKEKLSEAPLLYPFYPLLPFLIPDQYDSGPHLAEIKIPTLVIHGESDRVIPQIHGQQIYDKLRTQKWIWIIPNSHHIEGFFVNKGELKQRFISFLADLKS